MSSRLATQFLLIKSAFLVFFSVGMKLNTENRNEVRSRDYNKSPINLAQ